jgi:hypothetical protein
MSPAQELAKATRQSSQTLGLPSRDFIIEPSKAAECPKDFAARPQLMWITSSSLKMI